MDLANLPDLANVQVLIGYAIPLLKALATLVLGWTIAGYIQRAAVAAFDRANLDKALGKFFGQMVRYTIIFATLIAAAEALGFETTSLMTIFASAGLAVGLALQGSLGNFASGVMILFFRPFTIGDVITVGGITGPVLEIGMFATTLMKVDGTKVIVPNGAVTGDTIQNHTVLGKRRGAIDIGVDYGSDLVLVRAALQRAADKTDNVLDDPPALIRFVSFGGSSLDWQVHAWANPPDFFNMLEELACNIYDELNEAGIGIPFPQLDVHFDSAPPAPPAPPAST